jgi:hypothetical protein
MGKEEEGKEVMEGRSVTAAMVGSKAMVREGRTDDYPRTDRQADARGSWSEWIRAYWRECHGKQVRSFALRHSEHGKGRT